jgi:histidinol-phosphate aminotransferase
LSGRGDRPVASPGPISGPAAGSVPEPTPEVARLQPYSVPAAGRRGLLRLDFNENCVGPSPRVIEALRALTPEEVASYPDETAARAAVARHFGLGPAIDLVLTSGVDEGIRLVCDGFVRAGERVVLLDPGYPMYRFYATLCGSDLRSVEVGPDLAFPGAGVRAAVAGGCRLLILGDPHNPTGAPAPAGFIEAMAAAHPGTVVLADEAYAEFAGPTSIGLLDRFPNLVVARTFSKAYGLAGLRAGVLIGRRETLSWIARMRSPYAVNSAALAALVAALGDLEYVERYVAEVREARRRLADGLEKIGVPTFPSAANFVIARFGDRAPAVRAALRARGVLVRDRGDSPVLAGTLRIGVGTVAQAESCLAAVAAALAEVGGGGAS